MGGAGEGGSNLIGYAHDVTARAALDLAFGIDLDRRAALEAAPMPERGEGETGVVGLGGHDVTARADIAASSASLS
jgi:hypothetical protein